MARETGKGLGGAIGARVTPRIGKLGHYWIHAALRGFRTPAFMKTQSASRRFRVVVETGETHGR